MVAVPALEMAASEMAVGLEMVADGRERLPRPQFSSNLAMDAAPRARKEDA